MTQPNLENDQIDLSGVEVGAPDAPLSQEAPDLGPLPYLPEEQQPAGEAAPEPEVSEPETPAPVEAAPAPDLNAQMARLLEFQTREAEARQQREEQARQEAERQRQEAARPKPLMQRDEWRQEYEDVSERMSYDPQARARFMQMNAELAREEAQNLIAPMRQEIQLELRGDQALRSSFAQVQQQHGALVTEAEYQQVANQLFGGNRAALAQALDPSINPNAAQTQEYLADLVIGRRFRRGELTTPARPTPPPNPRSGARPAQPAQPTKSAADMWTDENYLNGVMADLTTRRF